MPTYGQVEITTTWNIQIALLNNSTLVEVHLKANGSRTDHVVSLSIREISSTDVVAAILGQEAVQGMNLFAVAEEVSRLGLKAIEEHNREVALLTKAARPSETKGRTET